MKSIIGEALQEFSDRYLSPRPQKLSEYREEHKSESAEPEITAAEFAEQHDQYYQEFQNQLEDLQIHFAQQMQEIHERRARQLEKLKADVDKAGLVDKNGRYPWEEGYTDNQ